MTTFILNDQLIHTDYPPGATVLDFVRQEKGLVGTKIGCREGDCGACTVLIGSLIAGKLHYQSMTSCITPLVNLMGKHLLTIDGINGTLLTPAQELMVQHNGTQCGFCTPGFIVSMTGFTMTDGDTGYAQGIKAIDGNICRCTGYKSIEKAVAALCKQLIDRPQGQPLEWLVAQGHLPAYMLQIQQRLRSLQEELIAKKSSANGKPVYFIGGGTDILVQKPEVTKKRQVTSLFDESQLRGIQIVQDECRLGAATTVTDLEQSPIFQQQFPNLDTHLDLVSSTPIRNMATIAGNLVNASPIGDMTIFFLALDASIQLNHHGKTRLLPLKHFYRAYKELDKQPAEFIEAIHFPLLTPDDHFNFEKVSKRTNLDIASVNTACKLRLHEDGSVASAHLSAGGVGPTPKYLANASTYLIDKKLDYPSLLELIRIVNDDISPISDARGTADYKRLLLRQLLLAHFIRFFGLTDPLQKMLHHA